MRKYYYKDADAQQQGPFSLEELKTKNISSETPVWYDPLPKWTTAAEVDELITIIGTTITVAESTPTLITEETPLAEPLIETPVVPEPVVVSPSVIEKTVSTTQPSITTTKTTSPVATTSKKSTAWVSWLLSILVLGGAGYYIYQDIEKAKSSNTASLNEMEKELKIDVSNDPAQSDTTITIDNSTNFADTTAVATEPLTTDPVTTTTTTTTPATTGATDADKKIAVKKKLEEEKKKSALAKQKADEIKKQEQAVLAKELQYRNNWAKYVTVGALNPTPKGDDGINAFDVPVYNATDAIIDKVTIRLDYYKKEKKDKIVSSETITVYKIPAKSGMMGKAPENRKARKVVATITSVSSKKIHLCYPQGGGNAADPYLCN